MAAKGAGVGGARPGGVLALVGLCPPVSPLCRELFSSPHILSFAIFASGSTLSLAGEERERDGIAVPGGRGEADLVDEGADPPRPTPADKDAVEV